MNIGTISSFHGQGEMPSVYFPFPSSAYPSSDYFITSISLSSICSVARAFRKEFKDLAGSADPILRSAGYELVPVDAHVPILDLRRFSNKPRNQILSNVAIQGGFDWNRRFYGDIFGDLNRSLQGLLLPPLSIRI